MLGVGLLLAFVVALAASPSVSPVGAAGPVEQAAGPASLGDQAEVQMAPVVGAEAQVVVTGEGVVGVRHLIDPDPAGYESSFARARAAAASEAAGASTLDTSRLSDGVHTLVTVLEYADGRIETRTSRFRVYRGPAALLFGADPLKLTVLQGGYSEQSFELATSTGSGAAYSLSSDAEWLKFEGGAPLSRAAEGVAPGRHTLEIDAARLTPGTYTATITATADGLAPAVTTVEVTVLAPQVDCAPLDCSEVRKAVPYVLEFDQDHGGLNDANGVGTGFTWISKPTAPGSVGYIPANLLMDLAAGELQITTTGGIAHLGENSQDNMLGVGIAAANQISVLDTVLVDIPAPTANFEQAGLWYGLDQDNYLKVALVAESGAVKVQFVEERGGIIAQQVVSGPIANVTSAAVHLRLRANPADRRITGFYGLNNGALTELSTFTVPPALFNADGAGIDPVLGTRVFGGIYATDRFVQGTRNYRFASFSLTTGGNPSQPGAFSWDRKSFPANFPSSMVLGPDGRLYFTETFGPVRAVTFDSNWNVTNNQVIYTFQGRLVLGITVDPTSTAQNVILWVAHSDGSFSGGQYAGAVNSGTVSKLTGPNWTREDVITGLPRALANHSTNSLHFGPDDRLYIAQGGNTGAGAPNEVNNEFGDRPEQPLSAALLVADVKAAGFDGSCAMDLGSFGPIPCDVSTYATGMRNMYDFVFHSNGSLYGPDNGLGVDGSYPPSPTPPCTGMASAVPYNQGGQNPGVQSDPLLRIEQGKYYGHPNPYREECVFKDGSYQGVAPLPNYVAPLLDLGMSRSANGITEYKSNAFGGLLKGNLLITNYSVGDNITRVVLSQDGRSVQLSESVVGGLNDPLPLLEGPGGILFVGEHAAANGQGRITILTPRAMGAWTTKAPLPKNLLDPGSAVAGGKLYLVAGKDGVGPFKSLYIYDPVSNAWTTGASLPDSYPAVENPAATVLNGKVYVFGGSQQPFSGAVANAAVYDPSTNTWAELPTMPTARGGATAQALGGKIYVMGGMGSDGASLSTVEIYDTAANSWAPGPAMNVQRDNPGSAVLGGKIYVFGGRTRSASGVETDTATPTRVEMFDPATGQWTDQIPLAVGRRTPVVGVVNGMALIIGGEATTSAGPQVYAVNEAYEPGLGPRPLTPMSVARHGAGGGTINGVTYVAGGSTAPGILATNVNEAFALDAPPPIDLPYRLYLPLIRR